jgi:hypothetical protein
MLGNCTEARKAFEECWNNPAYTQIELDDVDVNRTLSHYTTEEPVHFTREMLWDMEVKKAWDPGRYIPYVVHEGSAESWGRQCPSVDEEMYIRSSAQKQWLHPEVYETVYEEVYLNHRDQVVTFLGTKTLQDRPELTPGQPLFHVQHSVGGEEDRPLNKWRIVHLTETKDERLIQYFKRFNNPAMLPGFIKIYIEQDLHIPLSKK